jgi:hypothetical protein
LTDLLQASIFDAIIQKLRHQIFIQNVALHSSTYEIRGHLKANGYKWHSVGKYGWKTSPLESCSIDHLVNETWLIHADGVTIEMTLGEGFGAQVRRYQVNKGIWQETN